MAKINHTKLLDGVRATTQFWVSKEDKEKIKGTSKEEVLDLKFRKGEEVVDNVSGQKGQIIAGTRAVIGVQGTRSKRR